MFFSFSLNATERHYESILSFVGTGELENTVTYFLYKRKKSGQMRRESVLLSQAERPE